MFKVVVPTLTAFTDEGALDIEANETLWDRHIDGGMDGILLLGSNGEFYAQPKDMQLELVHSAITHIKGRAEVIVGTGQNSVAETIELSQRALELGADAAMVVTPYYFAFSKDELVRYYSEVARNVDGPLYLYNYPERTSNDLDAETVRRIVDMNPNVIGIKDTVAAMSHTRAIANVVFPVRPDFRLYCGMDENYVANALMGGYGGISAVCNLYPELMRGYVDAINSQDYELISKYQTAVNAAAEIYSVNGFFVAALKYGMTLRGVKMSTHCRSMMTELTESQKTTVKEIIDRVDSLILKITKE